ncbi:MAG: DUF357 domain-containing protein [Candidatus Aenigmatarchaeota archaeon]
MKIGKDNKKEKKPVNSTDQELREQTEKWLTKLEEEVQYMQFTEKIEKRVIQEATDNIHSYISDSKYFRDKGDMVRAFEAVMYAWGIYETCLRAGLVVKGQKLPEKKK